MSIQSYLFEPVKKNKNESKKTEDSDNNGWETVSKSENKHESNDCSVEQEELVKKIRRVVLETKECCKCGMCVKMPINRECLCCNEIDELKLKKLNTGEDFSFLSFFIFLYFIFLILCFFIPCFLFVCFFFVPSFSLR